MALFVIFIIWIAAMSVAIMTAYDEHTNKSYITLVILVVVLIIILYLAIFEPTLMGV